MLTLTEYARAKKLPVHFLRNLGICVTDKGLAIPYYSATLILIRTRYRHRLTGEPRFSWGEGETIIPYGLWKLNPRTDYTILCEGESDAQTLWLHDFNALGIPGASCWRREWRVHLAPYRRVYVWAEGDAANTAFIRRVATDAGKVWIVRVDGYKDPSALHIAQPDRFRAIVEEAMKAAAPYKTHTSGSRTRFWRPTCERAGVDTPSIVEVVEQAGVQLRRVGSQFVGLCPFHPDRHPSLCVAPDKNAWFCHSEGIGGGVQQFQERLNGK